MTDRTWTNMATPGWWASAIKPLSFARHARKPRFA